MQIEKIENVTGGHFYRLAHAEMLNKYPNLIELGETDQRSSLESEFQAMIKQKEKEYLRKRKDIEKRNYNLIKKLSKPELLEVLQKFNKSKDVSGGNVDDWNVQDMIGQGVLKCKIKRVGRGKLAHKGTIIQGIDSNWVISYEFGLISGEFETVGQGRYIKESIYRIIWGELNSKII